MGYWVIRTEQDKLSAGLLFFLVELTFLLFATLMSGSKNYPSRLVCVSPVSCFLMTT